LSRQDKSKILTTESRDAQRKTREKSIAQYASVLLLCETLRPLWLKILPFSQERRNDPHPFSSFRHLC
jgi:hypothetical protein